MTKRTVPFSTFNVLDQNVPDWVFEVPSNYEVVPYG